MQKGEKMKTEALSRLIKILQTEPKEAYKFIAENYEKMTAKELGYLVNELLFEFQYTCGTNDIEHDFSRAMSTIADNLEDWL